VTQLGDELLVAYVEGQLSPKQIRAVDEVLAQDDVTAARLTALREAQRRVEAAFEAILAREESEICTQVAPAKMAKSSERSAVAKAAAIATGIVLTVSIITLIAIAGRYGWSWAFQHLRALRGEAPQQAEIAPTWQEQAARASALLSRASGDESIERRASLHVTAFRLAQGLGSQVKVPNLTSQGFRFMSAQLLKVGDAPMAQVLYLPAEGMPLALYARSSMDRRAPTFHRYDTIGTVSWTDQGLGYLLAGRQDKALLFRLAEKIRHEPAQAPAPPSQPLFPDDAAPSILEAIEPQLLQAIPASVISDLKPDLELAENVESHGMLEPVKPENNLAAYQEPPVHEVNVSTLAQAPPPPIRRPIVKKEEPSPVRSAMRREKAHTAKTRAKARTMPMSVGTAKASPRSPAKGSVHRPSARGYAAKVWAALARHKLKHVGARGGATVSFVIGASGTLVDLRLHRSSGIARLDRAALATVRSAAPFPPPPPGAGRLPYTITMYFR
jgi:protein TonB